MPVNQYPEDSGVISIISTLFEAFWNGLCNINVPGFDFSFADVFLALLTAGLVGLILKACFHFFGSHLSDGWNSDQQNKYNSKGRSGKPVRSGKDH